MFVISFSRRDIDNIDQSEFEGFEYVNPLLMSMEDCVWEVSWLLQHDRVSQSIKSWLVY